MDFETKQLFNFNHSIAGEYLSQFEYPWQALDGIEEFILEFGKKLSSEEYDNRDAGIWIHKSAKVAPSAHIGGVCIIGPDAEIRHCAFIRGNAIVGARCVVGNSTELKNAILFDCVQVPHYNYVGDSILGYKSHMGAGSITSNVKADKSEVIVKANEIAIRTGRKKFGAILADYAEIGCNSVLNPGTIIGRGSTVYPLSSVRGVVPKDSIYKDGGIIVSKQREE